MKLVWLAHESGWSGANMCLFEYLDVLQKESAELYIIVPRQGEFARRLQEKNINVVVIKFYSWACPVGGRPPVIYRLKRWVRNRIAVNQITAYIKKINPHFVLTNTIVTPVAAKAAVITKRKHIWFIHEFGEEDHGFTIAGGFEKGARFINQLSAKVVFNSLAVQKKFGKYINENKQAIVNYVMETGERTIAYTGINEKFKLIMLGQIAPSKNQLDAIKALAVCKNQGLNFELNITGTVVDKTYMEQIASAINDTGLSDSIRMTGPVLNPGLFLQQHDALLMCSRMEAFGRVTAEALKMGLPVIAANTGGSTEIVTDSVNGYLYNSGDINDLAEKIITMYKNYTHFNNEAIAKAAREKYNATNTLHQLKQLFAVT